MKTVCLAFVVLSMVAALALGGVSRVDAVSERFDRRLVLVKRSGAAAEAGTAQAAVDAEPTALLEVGDNVHDARSIHAGSGARESLAAQALDAALPSVDLQHLNAAAEDAPAAGAAGAAGTTTTTAATAAVSDAATAAAAEKKKKKDDAARSKDARDTMPADVGPSARVKASALAPKPKPAASTDPADAHDARITRSQFDRRRYRSLTLANGLSVLLVSDAKTSRSAVAMDIGQGHYGDPESAPGLAHFLEHMLFLGTKKYPSEDSYDSYLSMYGGSDNAYTDNENTNFYFDIHAGHLHGALDRFAQFFIAPLLSENATGREMNAVDAEHAKNKQNDEWRETQLLQSFGYAGHPFHKFGTGSLKTLGNVPHKEMRALLFKFYRRWYHASNMRLVVLGKEKLSTLEGWVQGMFADVPRSPEGWQHYPFELASDAPARHVPSHPSTLHADVTRAVAATPALNGAAAAHAANPMGVVAIDEFADADMSFQKVFDPRHLGSVVYFKSVKDRRKLSLYWPLPHTHYDEKSLDYIATLLSNQHAGSLYSYLKHKGWVLHMDAGVGTGTHEYDVLQVTARLTEKGLTRPAAILSAVYAYLRLIREKGVDAWRWEEMKKLADIDFAMKSKERPIRYVSKLARDLREYRPADVLRGDYAYGRFNAAAIRTLLNLLVPANAVTFLSTSDMQRRVYLTQRERWYKTRYAQEAIPRKFVDAWTGALPKVDAPTYPAAASAPGTGLLEVASASAAEDDAEDEDEADDEAEDELNDEAGVHSMLDAAVAETEADEDADADEEDAAFLQVDATGADNASPKSLAGLSDAEQERELERRLKDVDAQIAAAEAKRRDQHKAKAALMGAAGAGAAAGAAKPTATDARIAAVDQELAAIDSDLKRMDAKRAKLDQAKAKAKAAVDAAAGAAAKTTATATATAATTAAAATAAVAADKTAAATATATVAPTAEWKRTKPAVALNEKDLRHGLHEKLALPPVNRFIAKDLTVFPVAANLPLSRTQVRPDPYARKPKKAVPASAGSNRNPALRPAFERSAELSASRTGAMDSLPAAGGNGQPKKPHSTADASDAEHTAFLDLSDLEHDPQPLPAARDTPLPSNALTAEVDAAADAEVDAETAAQEQAVIDALLAAGKSNRSSRKAKAAAAKAKAKAKAARRKALLARLRRRLVPIERNTDQTRNPIIIHERDRPHAMRVWYHQDRVFKRPRVNLRCRLWSPLVYTNARTYTTAALWVLFLEDSLTEFSYQTSQAGFSYVLGAGVYGVDFGVSGYGYSTGYRDYARTILEAIAKLDATPTPQRLARFELVRTRLHEQWVNARFAAPHAYSKYVADFVLHQPRYFTDQLADELATLSLDDVAAWHRALLTDVAAECFVHGNAAPRHAVTLIRLIRDAIPYRTISQPFALQYRGMRLVDRRMTKLPGQFTVSTVLPNPKDRNAALYNLYQFGQGTAESSLFANVLSMVAEKPAFHTLRTHEQLGYIVWALDDSRDGVQAFSIRIQSSTRSAEYLAERVRAFLGTLSALCRDVGDKQWQTLLRTLIAHKMKPALTLDQKTRRFWAHISNQRYRFDYYLTQVTLLRRKLPRMRAYFVKYVDELLGFHHADARAGVYKGKLAKRPGVAATAIGAPLEADFRMLSVQINPFGKHNKQTAKNHAPKPGSNRIKVADLKRKIAEAAKNKGKKKKAKAKKTAAPRFSETDTAAAVAVDADADADAEVDAAAEAEAATVEWAEDRESGELDSDTDSLRIDSAESDQVMALVAAAESEDGEAVDFEAEVERLLNADAADAADAADVAAAAPAFVELDASPVALVSASSSPVKTEADVAEQLTAEGESNDFAAIAHSAHTEAVELETALAETDAEAEDSAAPAADAANAVTDVSRLPVTVTLRRRGKKPRTVQILMEHLKTVSDELPLYPMRGVGALPPVYDSQAGAALDDPAVDANASKPSRP